MLKCPKRATLEITQNVHIRCIHQDVSPLYQTSPVPQHRCQGLFKKLFKVVSFQASIWVGVVDAGLTASQQQLSNLPDLPDNEESMHALFVVPVAATCCAGCCPSSTYAGA